MTVIHRLTAQVTRSDARRDRWVWELWTEDSSTHLTDWDDIEHIGDGPHYDPGYEPGVGYSTKVAAQAHADAVRDEYEETWDRLMNLVFDLYGASPAELETFIEVLTAMREDHES
jgi:hypothetical protein